MKRTSMNGAQRGTKLDISFHTYLFMFVLLPILHDLSFDVIYSYTTDDTNVWLLASGT